VGQTSKGTGKARAHVRRVRLAGAPAAPLAGLARVRALLRCALAALRLPYTHQIGYNQSIRLFDSVR
jgi:hypothetical protein